MALQPCNYYGTHGNASPTPRFGWSKSPWLQLLSFGELTTGGQVAGSHGIGTIPGRTTGVIWSFFGVSVGCCWFGVIWRLPQPFRIKAIFKMISPGYFLEAGQIWQRLLSHDPLLAQHSRSCPPLLPVHRWKSGAHAGGFGATDASMFDSMKVSIVSGWNHDHPVPSVSIWLHECELLLPWFGIITFGPFFDTRFACWGWCLSWNACLVGAMARQGVLSRAVLLLGCVALLRYIGVRKSFWMQLHFKVEPPKEKFGISIARSNRYLESLPCTGTNVIESM